MERHSWAVDHKIVDARGCSNRKVDKVKLRRMPWLRGTCSICRHFQWEEHQHRDFPLGMLLIHERCLNRKKG